MNRNEEMTALCVKSHSSAFGHIARRKSSLGPPRDDPIM